jgi:hypothetical protein
MSIKLALAALLAVFALTACTEEETEDWCNEAAPCPHTCDLIFLDDPNNGLGPLFTGLVDDERVVVKGITLTCQGENIFVTTGETHLITK